MSDELPAEQHQTLASSRYAKLIFYVTALMLLGMISTDRSQRAKVAMRDELVQRKFHADAMLQRAIQFQEGSTLPLLNICYALLGSSGPHCAVIREGTDLDLRQPDPVPVGILGNYAPNYAIPVAENRWGLPASEVLRRLDALVTRMGPLIARQDQAQIEQEIRACVDDFIEQAVMAVWKDSFPNDLPEPGRQFLRQVMAQADSWPRAPTLSADSVRTDVASTIKYLWSTGEKTSLDDAALQTVFRRSIGPAPAEEIISGTGDFWLFDAGELAQILLRSHKPELLAEEVAWLVTGGTATLDLDLEYNAENLGLGYVDQPHAVSDLPVFTASEFVALPLDKALERIRAYRVDIEKMLLGKAPTETPIEIFGSGINLQLSDLVILAGIIIALLQMLYVISLAQERNAAAPYRAPAGYPPFPRFSSPPDPFTGGFPATLELWYERLVYGAFLIFPTLIVLLGWLSHFELSALVHLLAHPLELWNAEITLDRLARLDGGFTEGIYALSLALSVTSLNRSIGSAGVSSTRLRWTPAGVIWRAGVATAVFALLASMSDSCYFAAAFIYTIAAVLAWLHDRRSIPLKTVGGILFWFGTALVLITIAGLFMSEGWRSAWRPLFFVLPFSGNFLFPVFVLWLGLFSALHQRQRLPCFLYSFVVLGLGISVMRSVVWALY